MHIKAKILDLQVHSTNKVASDIEHNRIAGPLGGPPFGVRITYGKKKVTN